jgi:hypothetical protein
MLPNGKQPGMIETLCVESVRADPAFECVEAFFRCVETKGIALPSGPIAAKSYAQAFLATRPEVQMFKALQPRRRR